VIPAEAPREHPLSRALMHALRSHRDAVLEAPTGTGKSTVVPLALLEEPWLAGRKILMLEPRRVAARAIASRMASLRHESVGQSIGYRMRLDTRVSRATRLEVLTEGVLTRLLQEDPALEDVGCVIFDEFHERSLQADLGLALALDARRQLGSPLRLILMSATLEADRIVALLGDAAQVRVPGRAFPVSIHYLGRGAPLLPAGPDAARETQRLCEAVTRAALRALDESGGDVLVFLPGARDIRRVGELLQHSGLPPQVRLMTLFGQMSGNEQDAVLEPAEPGTRKVVLATNLAETSLTIPGVSAVVDSGLVRRSRFDPGTGMSRLELERISRAASEQRAGRAGRVGPGVCYRLWSEGAHAALTAQSPPEILDADLAPLALDLACWGAGSDGALDWLDAPPVPMLEQARALLMRLGALDAAGRPTPLGRRIARLPVHPRLGAMLIAATGAVPGMRTLAAQLAALLSERDLLRAASDPDLHTRLELLRRPGGTYDRAAVDRIQRSARALAAMMGGDDAARPAHATDEDVGTLLAQAFPDRIGQRRDGKPGSFLLANGRGAAFSRPTSLARARFIVAASLDDRDREARIDLAAPLPLAALERVFADRIAIEERFGWDARAAAVMWRQTRRLDSLVLGELVRPPPEGDQTVAAMLEGVRQLGISALPWNAETRMLRARLEFVRALARPELAAWPASDDVALLAQLEDWLPVWLPGITRREHLARVPLADALRARLTGAQQRALESLAPRDLVMPTGSHIRVDYLDDNAPCVSVRLQEVFGLQSTPRIGGGTVAVTFKLLSPAQRPLQITRDLAGFWRSSYAEVRRDMRGRYPKHAWPENPLEATPTRGAGRPRGKGARR
jgi:ATP-dependent helicase HrpB